MGSKNIKQVAGIDIGSNSIRLIIAEITDNGKINVLEELIKSSQIGRDSFISGRISVDTIQETCDILQNFARLMYEYQIDDYQAVTTSGLREAENRDYVLEQIRVKTGLNIQIINNAEERYFTLKAIQEAMSGYDIMKDEGLLIVDIGSGGVEISIYKDGKLRLTEYSRVGSLRLSEVLADLESTTLYFPKIMEEFIDSKVHLLKHVIKSAKIINFIGLGGELNQILPLIETEEKRGLKYISRKSLDKLYSRVKNMTTDQIIKEFKLKHKEARLLLPSVIIFNYFIRQTGASGVYAPLVSLRHGIIADMVDKHFCDILSSDYKEDIINSARYMGQQYGIDDEHTKMVEKLALSIFDQTRDIHNLGELERIFLQIASILHDTGKFIDQNRHDFHSYNIINSQNIIGFSDRKMNIIANIVRYHQDDLPDLIDENYSNLNYRDRMVVSKLAAILKLANSLDLSYNQKINDINIIEDGNHLLFKITTKEDILLEKWSFQKKVDFFYEVMGYRPQLEIKDGNYEQYR